MNTTFRPEILAPAGDTDSFLAALAAGADAIYCGLKNFSARMEADNFSLTELSALTDLAHAKGVRVHVALNNLLKTPELAQAGRLVHRLAHQVRPDALIVQDLALPELARQAGFTGELHLSTLANGGTIAGLPHIAALGVNRLVLPRELSIDEIKAIAARCPAELSLEVFVHGALCYAVSGRCYWSSYLGGKSGLRGRCVQPCRRLYQQKNHKLPFFSCDDLSLDVLVRPLAGVDKVTSWKIEGRKKGPHYVYHTVTAYRLLRDAGNDPAQRKMAVELLDMALGRPGSHYNFLGHRPANPIADREQTGSGHLVAKVQGGAKAFFSPREPLKNGDLLRIGYEDQPGHQTVKIRRDIPKGGRLDLPRGPGRPAPQGAPVFLVDRRERELRNILDGLRQELGEGRKSAESTFAPTLPKPLGAKGPRGRIKTREMDVWRALPHRLGNQSEQAVWLTPGVERTISKNIFGRVWWWLPPVIWPGEEKAWTDCLETMTRLGAKQFVLNAPWQLGLFAKPERCTFWAGPMCNTANPLALAALARMGFAGAFVSPELDRDGFLELPKTSPLPLGILVKGIHPLCVARIRSEHLRERDPFQSPKGEQFWSRTYGQLVWTFPNWALDLSEKWAELERAGYAVLARLHEPVPEKVTIKERQGLWNWELQML
ncbi:MAG: U32 family peptidase [Deltaproteobacteria bacterium]|nr:U32 family peptidase [Deltaproteobacteria bacterium]